MTTDKNDGGPVFPTYYHDTQPMTGEQVVRYTAHGMTLREWLTGQALEGLLSNPDWTGNSTIKPDKGWSIPEIAVKAADAALAELAKETPDAK